MRERECVYVFVSKSFEQTSSGQRVKGHSRNKKHLVGDDVNDGCICERLEVRTPCC